MKENDLKIYLLVNDSLWGEDVYRSAVVLSESEEKAILIHPVSDFYHNVFFDNDKKQWVIDDGDDDVTVDYSWPTIENISVSYLGDFSGKECNYGCVICSDYEEKCSE